MNKYFHFQLGSWFSPFKITRKGLETKKKKRVKDMKTIEATIERAKDGTFSVYCITEMFTGNTSKVIY